MEFLNSPIAPQTRQTPLLDEPLGDSMRHLWTQPLLFFAVDFFVLVSTISVLILQHLADNGANETPSVTHFWYIYQCCNIGACANREGGVIPPR